ncbi:MAG: DedA family protein [Candidatus Eremiobacteraeota bacterium]|nr:DedA family protein [Candidatus Eremiobacteraeota bacterium]
MHGLTDFFMHLIDHVGYFGLFVAMMLGNIGAPVGSEVLLPAAGALTATGHLPNLALTIAVSVFAELAGQSLAYAIGRFGGRPFVEKFGKYVRFHHKELDRAHAFFERYGTFAIFISRFTPVIRGIIGIPAGIAEMPLVPFYLWTFFGSLIFCGGLILLGNSLGTHFDQVTPLVHKFGLALIGLIVIVLAAWFVIARKRSNQPA